MAERTMMIIEKAMEKDSGAISELDSMITGNPGRRDIIADAINADRCFLAWTQNTLVGFGILDQSFFGQGFISLLMVHPDHRGRGIATSIIHHIGSMCPTEKLFTSTNKSNVIAQQLFEARGFIKSGYIENLDDDDPEIIYFKHLCGSA